MFFCCFFFSPGIFPTLLPLTPHISPVRVILPDWLHSVAWWWWHILYTWRSSAKLLCSSACKWNGKGSTRFYSPWLKALFYSTVCVCSTRHSFGVLTPPYPHSIYMRFSNCHIFIYDFLLNPVSFLFSFLWSFIFVGTCPFPPCPIMSLRGTLSTYVWKAAETKLPWA